MVGEIRGKISSISESESYFVMKDIAVGGGKDISVGCGTALGWFVERFSWSS